MKRMECNCQQKINSDFLLFSRLSNPTARAFLRIMQNVSTLYRFNTPFLDIMKEKDFLIQIKEKIKDFVTRFE
jgi:hypothetical protein